MPGRVATFVICSKTPSSKSERSFSVAKMRAGTSIPALWETGISQTVSEIRTISIGTGTAHLPPAVLPQLYREVLRDRFPPQQLLPDPVTGELVSDAAAPVPFPLGPEDRLVPRLLRPREAGVVFPAHLLHPSPDHLEVQVLRERVEGDPDSEPSREGDLFLHGLPVVDLPSRHHRAAVVAVVRGGQVPPVGRHVDQDVLRRRVHRAVEGALQHLVARLPRLEGEVVGEEDEFMGEALPFAHDGGEVDEVVLIHLDDPKSLGGVRMEERPDERRFPGAARPPQKDVVRGEASKELPGVLLHHPFLLLDTEQVREVEGLDVPDRFEVSREGALPPVRGDALRPVDPGHGTRQQRLEGGKHPFQLCGQFRVRFHVHSCRRGLSLNAGTSPRRAGTSVRVPLRARTVPPEGLGRAPSATVAGSRRARTGRPRSRRRSTPPCPRRPPGSPFSRRNPRSCPWRRGRRTPSEACPPRRRTIYHHTPRSGTPGVARTNPPPRRAGPAASLREGPAGSSFPRTHTPRPIVGGDG